MKSILAVVVLGSLAATPAFAGGGTQLIKGPGQTGGSIVAPNTSPNGGKPGIGTGTASIGGTHVTKPKPK